MSRRRAESPSRALAGRVPVWPKAIPVRERMRSPVVTIGPEAAVRDAAELMIAGKIRHLPVVEAGGRLIGIVTDRDLRQVLFSSAGQERLRLGVEAVGDLAVRDVMTWAVVTVGPGTDVRAAARLMHEQKIGALPVTEDGRLVGILTESDVLATLEEALRAQVTTVRPFGGRPSAEAYDHGFPEPGGGVLEPETGTPANPGTEEPPSTCR
ncbi:MAG TPA: CBS domain-containing protein [Methylomirabilota bacterium]|nr:CBS domain-containing protein [Methylomirabilota bacterium]